MSIPRLVCVFLVASGLVMAAPDFALAQVACSMPVCGSVPAPPAPRVDPKLRLLERQVQLFGDDAPVFQHQSAGPVTRLGALLRFNRLLSPTEIRAVENAGIGFHRNSDGSVVRIGRIYRAFVPVGRVAVLAGLSHLVRAESTWAPVILSPLDVTTDEIGVTAARAVSSVNEGVAFTGEGVLVANIDSGIDVLHPHFFKADGGYFDWIDVSGTGRFDPGTDAVDLDGDGRFDVNETLRVLDATRVPIDPQLGPENQDGVLQPRFDWLYADSNGDGVRNAGKELGFFEDDAAYGEPLFVVDDVNRNGRLDLGEKLVRLKTSKIRKVTLGERTYVRGQDLIQVADDPEFGDSRHGTGVMSILLGGQLGFHDLIGVAPGAEGIVYQSRQQQSPEASEVLDQSPQFAALQDAMAEDAALVLHEWTNPFSVPHDGSTVLEQAMDEARDAGIAQINPVGNLNLSQKHIERPIVPEVAETISFDVQGEFGFGENERPYSVVYLSLYWSGGNTLDVTLTSPSGQAEPLVFDAEPRFVGTSTDAVAATLETTSRGSTHAFVTIWSQEWQTESIEQGTWRVRLDGASLPDRIRGRISDAWSGWALGVRWLEATRDLSTAVYPSTADSAFGVAAYAGRFDNEFGDDSRVGELRNFSGRGPRFDGAALVDLAAPDDPFAAFAATPEFVSSGWGRSWFMPFGGTSGAGPHVAGAYALLREKFPDEGVDALEARLISGANDRRTVPDLGSFPNSGWGHGRLDVYQTLFDDLRPVDLDSNLVVDADARFRDGILTIDASMSRDEQGRALLFRFDVGYTGEWDSLWQEQAVFEYSVDPSAVPETVRVQIRVGKGEEVGAIVPVEGFGGSDDAGEDAMPDMGGADLGVEPAPARPGPRGARCAKVVNLQPGSSTFAVAVLMLAWVFRRERRLSSHAR